MMAYISSTEYQTLVALRTFLTAILPAGVAVIRAEQSRVPEPSGTDFVVMTPTHRERLSTNVASYEDTLFLGGISGTVLTVNSISSGTMGVGQPISGPGVVTGTVVTALGTGTGGVGTYAVLPSQSAPTAQLLGGEYNVLQPTQITFQLDIHGPSSADNAQIISTLIRDTYACQSMAATIDAQPLFASEPRQAAFQNAEQQFEYRWTMDVVIQANPVITVQQDFADKLIVTPVEIDATYPPGA
ncbi:MAG TPA: hypothetical protein VGP33_03455 [Chloroflexota bacterium]|jgi:hypothetical protein|nr:hypothetical protein [Chloroflexota bacterium]